MNEYEVLIETINPCGGEAHANKEFKEIEAESPESYVAQNAVSYTHLTLPTTCDV